MSQQTKVVAKCVSKKEIQHYREDHPIRTEIELEIPYDENSVYYQMSGDSNFALRTVNQSAADMFVIGKNYEILIRPSEE